MDTALSFSLPIDYLQNQLKRNNACEKRRFITILKNRKTLWGYQGQP
jgi:hypothetical protein